MSYLIAAANGNLTAAATWDVADATSLSDSEAANTALTTSAVASSTFTPGAITIDAIAVKLASRAASPSGTMTVALDQAGGTVAGTSVTVNVSDLPTCSTGAANNEGGWFLFKFAAPVTLIAATAYSVKASTSVAAQVNLYSTATTNWSRLLRTTTTQAPTSADLLVVTGEWTAAATVTARTVTMDSVSTSALLVGAGASGAINICNNGTLQYGVAASTAYYLLVGNGTTASDIRVYNGGTLTRGTLGSPMPSTSSAVLEGNVTAGQADGLSGLIVKNGGTYTTFGAAIAAAQTTLTADIAAAAQNNIAVASTSGWAANDVIVFASTTRTAAQTEKATVSSVPDGMHVSLSAGVANAHGGGGTANVIAEVMHLTRNVKLRSNQTTLGSTGSFYVDFKPGSIVSLTNEEFSFLGANTAGQRGVEVETTTGTFAITGCVVHDCRNGGFYVASASGSSITVSALNLWNCNTANTVSSVTTTVTSGVPTYDKVWILGCTGTGANLADAGSTYTNWVIAGCTSNGMTFGENAQVGTWYGHSIHSNTSNGISMTFGTLWGTLGNAAFTTKIWRNNNWGWNSNNGHDTLIFDTWRMFGNVTNNIGLGGFNASSARLRNCTLDSDNTFTTATNLNIATSGNVYLQGCTLSQTVAATTDINHNDSPMAAEVVMWGGALGGTTAVATPAAQGVTVRLNNVNVGGVAGQYRSHSWAGTIIRDTATVHTAGGASWKMTPNGSSSVARPLRYPGPSELGGIAQHYVLVPAGLVTSLVISVWAYISSYTSGSALALHVPGGYVAGAGSFGTDVGSASADTGTVGSWQQLKVTLSGGTLPTAAGYLPIQLTVDGTQVVYVDDFAVSGS